MQLLRMNERRDRGRVGEPVTSLMGGVPSLTISLGSLVLLVSYMIDHPIGPPELYRVERSTYSGYSETRGALPAIFFSVVLPTACLFGLLAAGIWCGGLGIYLAGRRRRDRRATTSIAGMITCGTAFILAWLGTARAAAF